MKLFEIRWILRFLRKSPFTIYRAYTKIRKGFITGQILYPDIYPTCERKIPNVKDIANHYKMNINEIESSIINKEVKTLICLQPYNGSGKREQTIFDKSSVLFLKRKCYGDGSNQYDKNVSVFQEIKTIFQNKDNFQDLTNVFDNVKGEVWLDHIHFSDIGADILAREVATKYYLISKDD